MNFQRLNKLTDLLADTEGKLRRYNGEDQDPVLQEMWAQLGDMTGGFAHQKDVSRRARLRLLKSIYAEMLILRTVCKLEIEQAMADLETPAPTSDLASSQVRGQAVNSKGGRE